MVKAQHKQLFSGLEANVFVSHALLYCSGICVLLGLAVNTKASAT